MIVQGSDVMDGPARPAEPAAPPSPPKRGRPRDPGADRAIIEATLALLAEGGFSNLTLDAVAARARVAKSTIYRRWPSKADLLAEALGRVLAQPSPTPDTGSARDDLVALVREQLASLSSPPGDMIRALLTDVLEHELLAGVLRTLLRSRRDAYLEILSRAAERGEAVGDRRPELALDLLFGPLWLNLLVAQRPLDPELADDIVAFALDGIRPNGVEG